MDDRRDARLRNASLAVVAGLLGAAIAKERRTPREHRQWVGKIAGVVPYDLRPPTFERVWGAIWSPDDERILVPHPFGVGWTVNIGRIVRIAGGLGHK